MIKPCTELFYSNVFSNNLQWIKYAEQKQLHMQNKQHLIRSALRQDIQKSTRSV